MTTPQDPQALQTQYGTAANLSVRQALHARFSTNPLGWNNWALRQYGLCPGQHVLELGCGNGGQWTGRGAELQGVALLLSDFSQGMLQAARENTAGIPSVAYACIDAQDIPLPDGKFDMVIANHMLYHVPDIERALGEIARVLKPGGTLCATTLGSKNLCELTALLHTFDPAIDFTQRAITDVFGLESGAPKLRRHFARVELRRYPDSLHVTQAQPLVDYVLSFMGMGNINEEQASRLLCHLDDKIARDGAIDITKDAGMFTASKE